MSRLIFLLVVSVVISQFAAAETHTEKRRFNKRAAYEAKVAANGGLVTRPYQGKEIVVVNDQQRVAQGDFFEQRHSIERIFQFPVKIVKPGSDVSNAAVIITVSDSNGAPALLVAPEKPWAGVNVAALATDNPSNEVLKLRLRKEIWRAFMYACGAANSINQPCVMRPIFGLRDLDAHPIDVPCPDSLDRVVNCAKALGVGGVSHCTYRQACQEGWATAPTNDIQKAIWDEIHTPPSDPLKITFDPKTDTK